MGTNGGVREQKAGGDACNGNRKKKRYGIERGEVKSVSSMLLLSNLDKATSSSSLQMIYYNRYLTCRLERRGGWEGEKLWLG